MANQYKNKIIYGGETLIDLTQDDVLVSDVAAGKKFHLPSGAPAVGTSTYDADTSDASAVASEILSGKTAYKNGSKLTGTMPNRGAQVISITTVSTTNYISNGYHDGSGYAVIDPTELSKLIPSNIRDNVVILGVEGTMSAEEGVHATTKTVTPIITAQTYTPPTDYNYFTQFTVNAIPYVEADNAAGGKTVTIAGS